MVEGGWGRWPGRSAWKEYVVLVASPQATTLLPADISSITHHRNHRVLATALTGTVATPLALPE